ncbi:MAG: hypothetical protein AAGJ38_01275 [Planctomycetota bacterium]
MKYFPGWTFQPLAWAVVALTTIVATAGCVSDRSPKELQQAVSYLPLSEVLAAIQDSREAQAAVTAVRSPIHVEIREDNGKTTRLEGALAIRNPGEVRLKLWRQGRDVMDLTQVDGRSYAWLDDRIANRTERNGDRGSKGAEASKSIAIDERLSDWLSALVWFVTPDTPTEPTLADLRGSPSGETIVKAIGGKVRTEPMQGEQRRYDADTGVLVSRSFANDTNWRVGFEYAKEIETRRVGITVFADQTRVRIHLNKPVWNETLSDALFVPPGRSRLLTEGTPP